MRKTLVALALAGSVFTMSTDLARAENLELGLNNKKPHEQVQEYLDPFGVAREEFRSKHYLFRDKKGILHYNRSYDFGGKKFVEQYVITNSVVPDKDGISHVISTYPNYYFFEGIWYFDPFSDGFNGNEMVDEGGTVKKPGHKIANEEKCNSRKSGFCI